MERSRHHTRILKRRRVEIVLLDTNILIDILKGDQETIEKVQNFYKNLAISSITEMELSYGALNKAELKKLERFVSLFKVVHLDEKASLLATKLIKKYAKSHNLDIPDSLIAACALANNYKLFTHNVKDFKYIENIVLL